MANELTINLPTMTYVKDVYNDSILPGVISMTVNGRHAIHDNMTLSTSDSTLSKGNVGTIGFFYFRNRDITNNIQIGSDGTLFPLTLKPGEVALGRWNAAAIHAKAAVGTPSLEYWVIED
jgi:hypothetical protein